MEKRTDYGKQINLSITSQTKEERSIACNAILVKTNENGERQFLLGLRAKHKSGGGQWGLIGGTQAKGETMEETLKRELKEEINIDVKLENIVWNNFFQCIAAPGVHFDHHGFVVETWSGKIENMEPNKCDGLKWFNENELPLDNFFVSKGNLLNFLENKEYQSKNNFNYNNQ